MASEAELGSTPLHDFLYSSQEVGGPFDTFCTRVTTLVTAVAPREAGEDDEQIKLLPVIGRRCPATSHTASAPYFLPLAGPVSSRPQKDTTQRATAWSPSPAEGRWTTQRPRPPTRAPVLTADGSPTQQLPLGPVIGKRSSKDRQAKGRLSAHDAAAASCLSPRADGDVLLRLPLPTEQSSHFLHVPTGGTGSRATAVAAGAVPETAKEGSGGAYVPASVTASAATHPAPSWPPLSFHHLPATPPPTLTEGHSPQLTDAAPRQH